MRWIARAHAVYSRASRLQRECRSARTIRDDARLAAWDEMEISSDRDGRAQIYLAAGTWPRKPLRGAHSSFRRLPTRGLAAVAVELARAERHSR